MPQQRRERRNLPANLHHLRASDEVKCVIGTREDYDWAKTQLRQLFGKCEVLFSWVNPLEADQQSDVLKSVPVDHTPLPAANWPRPSLPIAFPSGSNSNNTNTFGRPIKRAFDEPAPQAPQHVRKPHVTHLAEDGAWPIVWERAKGVHVWDTDGKKYLDLTGAFAVAATGHANPRVTQAAQAQFAKLPHAMGDVHPHPLKGELARALSKLTFERWAKRESTGA